MKKNPDMYLGKAYEPVSDVFHAAVEDTLSKIGKEQQMKVRHIPKIWAIAAAFVLIVGTAFAAGTGLKLMDFLKNNDSGILPLEHAETFIQNSLLVYTDENVVWTVDQAAYDGECIRALVKAAPASPETHALSLPSLEDLPLKIEDRNVLDEQSKKIPVHVGFPELEAAGDSQNVDIYRTIIQGVYLSQSGEYSLYIFCPLTLREIDTAPETLALWLFDSNDMNIKGAFSLAKSVSETAVYLNSDTTLSDAAIKNVSLTQTPFASYLEIIYAYQRSGPDLTLDAQTTYYATQSGAFLHTSPTCSGMKNALELSKEEAEAMKKDYLCPICAGGNLEAITDTTTGGQIDFSISDTQLPFFFGGHESKVENGFKKTYIFSASEAFPEEITLKLIKKGEFTGDSLTLSIIR